MRILPSIFITPNLIALLFVAGVGFQVSHAHESSDTETTVIHITDKGYTPQSISIPVGSRVIFENTDEEKHWPASDNHPSHRNYNGTSLVKHCFGNETKSFDACRGLEKGEEYSFVFNKVGKHNYHDHLWTHLTGEINVYGTENRDDTVRDKNIVDIILDFIEKLFNPEK